ncbi:Uncharacterised protein [Mycobacteroides abscessus subsp. abscessus]|nr:Uncharacterised protein [Mycobacteroides abscessus subsp. abscessus]
MRQLGGIDRPVLGQVVELAVTEHHEVLVAGHQEIAGLGVRGRDLLSGVLAGHRRGQTRLGCGIGQRDRVVRVGRGEQLGQLGGLGVGELDLLSLDVDGRIRRSRSRFGSAGCGVAGDWGGRCRRGRGDRVVDRLCLGQRFLFALLGVVFLVVEELFGLGRGLRCLRRQRRAGAVASAEGVAAQRRAARAASESLVAQAREQLAQIVAFGLELLVRWGKNRRERGRQRQRRGFGAGRCWSIQSRRLRGNDRCRCGVEELADLVVGGIELSLRGVGLCLHRARGPLVGQMPVIGKLLACSLIGIQYRPVHVGAALAHCGQLRHQGLDLAFEFSHRRQMRRELLAILVKIRLIGLAHRPVYLGEQFRDAPKPVSERLLHLRGVQLQSRRWACIPHRAFRSVLKTKHLLLLRFAQQRVQLLDARRIFG